MDDDIALPPVTHPSVVNAMRQAAPIEPFNEHAALQRMQRVAFLRALHANPNAPPIDPALTAEWHAHLSRVAVYSQVKSPAPPPTVAPLPAVTVPRTPRPTVPASVQQTPAFAAITNRTAQRAGLSQAASVIGALWNVKTPLDATDNTQT